MLEWLELRSSLRSIAQFLSALVSCDLSEIEGVSHHFAPGGMSRLLRLGLFSLFVLGGNVFIRLGSILLAERGKALFESRI